MAARLLAGLSVFVLAVVLASQSIGSDAAVVHGKKEVPPELLQQLELAKLCQPRDTKPEPEVNQFKAKTAAGWGRHRFDCIVANLSAYLELDGGKQYIPLDIGVVDEAGSVCPHPDEALGMFMGVLRIDYLCAKVSFFIARTGPTAPMKITHVHTNLNFPHLDNMVPVPSGSADEVNHVGFKTDEIGHAYQCKSEQKIALKHKWTFVHSAKLVIANLTLEAFRDVTEPDFYQPKTRCKLDAKFHSDSFKSGHESMYV